MKIKPGTEECLDCAFASINGICPVFYETDEDGYCHLYTSKEEKEIERLANKSW